MPTLTQLSKKPRKSKKKTTQSVTAPQRKGTCIKLYIRSPKKPNSADRKVAKVRLSSGKIIIAYIPGEAHSIPEHATVLVRGGRTPDLPGVKFKIIRGAEDAKSVTGRKQARSRYGEKKPSN
jgi:small subunit ribosomal protein S12|uniref:ribosomal protein S12 n=1 Tax=Ancyromonas sigmoides TaxID=85707 RepID=UPI0028D59A9E|nr:ribosomal protein S12 [Ancyromonas sigmoides]WMQ52553.1 ribosomal protein S12 [Ancyromonas sigmoides]